MNLRQIEVFRAVMLAGSVTDAARQLHVSQPGVSRMLAHIELQLGLRLFERRKRRLMPTLEATSLFEEVQRVYGGVSRIEARAQALKSGETLTLRVVTSPSTGLAVVPAALQALVQRYPASRYKLEVLPARDMTRQLIDREADIAIATAHLDHASLQAQPIGRWTLVCVFPPGHPLGEHDILTPRQILAHRLIAFGADTSQGRQIAQWSARHRLPVDAPIEVRAGQTACALVASGAGIALVDDLTARACMPDRLDWRPIRGAPSFDVHAVTHGDHAGSALMAGFIEEVSKALRPPKHRP